MKNQRSPLGVFRRLQALYSRMDQAYVNTAQSLGFTCLGCTDNCCTSFFQHHTYVEWAFLWKGLDSLPAQRRSAYLERARATVKLYREAMDRGERPRAMCPLNDDGRCGLYGHRLMICRLHGTANLLRRPDGRRVEFPGCFRFQDAAQGLESSHSLDRTQLYHDLVALELDFLGSQRSRLPKVDLTLAEMLVYGPPQTKT